MNPPPAPSRPPDDPLDALLREADEYIPDEGFTRRVMAALPPRRRREWRRAGILAGATLLGGALAAWQLPAPAAVSELAAMDWRAAAPQLIQLLLPVLTALAALGWSLYALITEEA
jgi:hypothetical protein